MFATCVLATFAATAILASGADLKGTWSATAQSGYLAGSWTAQPDPSGGATGAWMLQDASGKVLMQGGWSASKSAQAWNGAWRPTLGLVVDPGIALTAASVPCRFTLPVLAISLLAKFFYRRIQGIPQDSPHSKKLARNGSKQRGRDS
jgi:hypothetical protein